MFDVRRFFRMGCAHPGPSGRHGERRLSSVAVSIGLIVLPHSQDSVAYLQEIAIPAKKLAESMVRAGKKSVAAADFTDLQGNVTELGRFVAEQFSVALGEHEGDFEIVDRMHLTSILEEARLSASGLVDPETSRRVGQIAGVEALVTGTITPFGDSVNVSVKLIDTTSARIIVSSVTSLAKTDAIMELLERDIGSGSRGQSKRDIAQAEPATPASPEMRQVVGKKGVFSFAVTQCDRVDTEVICSLTASNDSGTAARLDLCDSVLVDDAGYQTAVRAVVSPGRCTDTFEPNLPVAISLSAGGFSPTARTVNIVLKGAFGGSATRRGFGGIGQAVSFVLRDVPLVQK